MNIGSAAAVGCNFEFFVRDVDGSQDKIYALLDWWQLLFSKKNLDGQAGLVYSNDGHAFACGRKLSSKCPVFSSGDTVILTVDCEAGIFSIKVNDGKSIAAFTNIPSFGNVVDLRLAASVNLSSGIELIDSRQTVTVR